MKTLRVLKRVLHQTKADRILISYLIFVLLDALFIFLIDPAITTYRSSIWYCCSTISTAGFGDVVVTTFAGKVATIVLMAYSLVALAIITGVIVNYYNQLISTRQKDTIEAFMHKLEHLPELSKEELAELSEQVKNFKHKK